MAYHSILSVVPRAIQQDLGIYLFFICSLYNHLHLLIPDPQFTPPQHPWQPQICSLCLSLCLFHR